MIQNLCGGRESGSGGGGVVGVGGGGGCGDDVGVNGGWRW